MGKLARVRTWAARWRAAIGWGCIAVALATAGSARAGCDVTKLAELPLNDAGGFLTLPASIDGTAVSLLLDTGAASELLTVAAAERLGLPSDPGRYTLIQGTGGDAGLSPHVRIARLGLGGLEVSDLSAPLGALPAVPRVVPPVAGLLGADVLSRFDVDLDLPRHRMLLYEVASGPGPGPRCEAATLPRWEGRFQTIRVRRSEDRLIVEARVNQRKVDALIDTGARSIILGAATAERLGVGPATLAGDPGGVTGGVDMREVAFHWHRFATLQVGDLTIYNPVLTVSPLQEEADMLLGSAFLTGRRMWLSYATNRVFVQERD